MGRILEYKVLYEVSYTALHWSSSNGHDSTVKTLIDLKANKEAKSNDGYDLET